MIISIRIFLLLSLTIPTLSFVVHNSNPLNQLKAKINAPSHYPCFTTSPPHPSPTSLNSASSPITITRATSDPSVLQASKFFTSTFWGVTKSNTQVSDSEEEVCDDPERREMERREGIRERFAIRVNT